MGFRRKLLYLLVHRLAISNKEAKELLASGKVTIDGAVITENCPVFPQQEITAGNSHVQVATTYRYYAFNKPRGFESTLNAKLPCSIESFFPQPIGLSIAGRLDKESEGLLLLSDDGKWVEEICNPLQEKEKEYLVEVDHPLTEEFYTAMQSGVEFRQGVYSKPCKVEARAATCFAIVLTEGKNRQIRRMCKKLGYEVLKLKRIRIESWLLEALKEGQYIDIQINK